MPADDHDYRECRDPDCPRFPCIVYKEGFRDGWDAGFTDGYSEGYADGYADGAAAAARE